MMVYACLMCTLTGQMVSKETCARSIWRTEYHSPLQPTRYSASLHPKLGLLEISGTCVKASTVALFVFLKIEFYEYFR